MATSNPTKHILVIPFPAQGHLLPLLDLVHLLSIRHGFSLSILVTPQNLPLIQSFLSSTPAASPLVFPLPSHPSVPSGIEHSRHLPPHIHHAFLSLPLSLLKPQILSWAKSIPNPISLLISDSFLGWTESLAREIGVPRVYFACTGGFGTAVVDYVFLHVPKKSNELIQLDSLPSSPSFPFSELPQMFGCYKPGDPDWEFIRESILANFTSWGLFTNTFNALESEYISYLKNFYGHNRVWAVGPIQPTGPPTSRGGNSSVSSVELEKWFDTCPPKSVVYVCFGSQHTPSVSQACAIASALELSGVRFIWALGGLSSVIPEGFEEKTKGKGLVIRGWAPQVEILHHPAVGSFLTHSGWNSVLEGVMAGVTLLTWPMKAEQFVNAKLLVEAVGIAAKAASGSDAVPEVEELAKVFAESVRMKTGSLTAMQEKAVEMQREAVAAVKEGGSSHKDILDFVDAVSLLGINK
ncbi:UDP-glycosyltransferase 89B1 [Rhynchospora pubera]|uniref:UDP-glycosyltransferase 89B1 n=1 Tax=Rhynchospora pubera TaxID=906938 RepID=A0AAV8G6W0_9POAL|nr:UDP-glycosyltransferase 89B1 [Rhynchospora pubera]KAJ4746363.1 UDP-glycosyltransferase 89B1 [Rhynchospora pubera]KAJ4799975.1 UDP-glycosyltransferase 89B1 [Rhynchospora pubera]